MAKKQVTKGEVERLDLQTAVIRVVGESPLLVHRFSEKSATQMLAKQMGLASSGREKREPALDYVRSAYLMGDCFGFPAGAFKMAMVRGSKGTSSLPMTDMRQAFRVLSDDPASGLVRVVGVPNLDFAAARNDNGGMDLRFRLRLDPWCATLRVKFNARAITLEQLTQCAVGSGFGVGVGDWRQERGGDHGAYRICTPEEIDAVAQAAEEPTKAWFLEHAERIAQVRAEGTRLWELLENEGADLAGVNREAFDAAKKVADPKPPRKQRSNGAAAITED